MTGMATPPRWRIPSATPASSVSRRAASTTFAPSAASIAASPAPIPTDAPVTTATRPASTAIATPLLSPWTAIMPVGPKVRAGPIQILG